MYTPEFVACTKGLEYLADKPADAFLWLCTPVKAEGSYPTPVHAKMAVWPEAFAGTVGGGNIEFSVIGYVQQFLFAPDAAKTDALLLDYSMTAESVCCAGMACGGDVTVLMQRVGRATLERHLELLDGHGWSERFCWTHRREIPRPDERRFITLYALPGFSHQYQQEQLAEPIRVEATQISRQILGAPTVHIFGGGHVGRCVAEVARVGGFKVQLYEDREYLLEGLHAQITIHRVDLENGEVLNGIFEGVCAKADQFVVIVTRGHKCDAAVVNSIFKQKAMPKYVGLIGSQTKLGKTWARMRELFGDAIEEKIQQIKAPIGLPEVGGDQPGQIAVAIVAQMIQTLTNGKKRYM